MSRSKVLDIHAVAQITREFVEKTLELKYDNMETHIFDPALNDIMQSVYDDALKLTEQALIARTDVGDGWHTMGFTAVTAEQLCNDSGYEVKED